MMIATSLETRPTGPYPTCLPPSHSYTLPQASSGRRHAISDSEAGLHTLWARCAGRTLSGLQGTHELVLPGRLNGGPGPDFLGAVIRFPDGQLRRGDVEIHLSQYGWRAHRHHQDPRYAAVMAHVVMGGPLRPVSSVSGGIPTLRMPALPAPETRPCEAGARLTGEEAARLGSELLTDLAQLRWLSRFSAWQAARPDAHLMHLARRLGPGAGAGRLFLDWQKFLSPDDHLQRFLTLTGSGGSAEPDCSAGRKLLRRARLLSAVAYQTTIAASTVPDNAWDAVQQILRQLRYLGHKPPSRNFAVEVAGNWLILWLAHNRGIDGFIQWSSLSLGWIYERVKRLASSVGLPRPANFAQQQGWLEWEQSLCVDGLCHACPLSG